MEQRGREDAYEREGKKNAERIERRKSREK